jgi:predicted N-acetyltransferase YhbS
MDIRLQHSKETEEVEKLLDLTFGNDRLNKAAYQYRSNVEPIKELSFVTYLSDKLIATLQFWPIKINRTEALLLGPIAVLPELQGQGYGLSLMGHGLDTAKSLGHKIVVLVGDEKYYQKVGFSRKLAEKLIMPGQTDETRLLARELVDGAFDNISGIITK